MTHTQHVSGHMIFLKVLLTVFTFSLCPPPPPVAPIDNVYSTLGLVKARKTQEYAERSGLKDEIEGKGSYTMFAPSNEAWNQLDSVSRTWIQNLSELI